MAVLLLSFKRKKNNKRREEEEEEEINEPILHLHSRSATISTFIARDTLVSMLA